MDPLTAISLAGNIIAFVDFGFKAVNAAREIKESVSGSTAENDHLKFLTTQIQGHTQALQKYVPVSGMTPEEQGLDKLVQECQSLSGDLLKLLQNLQAKSSNKSKRDAISTMFRNLRKKNEKGDLFTRLQRCQEQLHFQISQMDRQDAQTKLSSIINSRKSQDLELQKLSKQVESLQNGVHVTSLSPELLADIRRLLNVTDDTMSKIIQATLLKALEQDKMGDRYDAVETAYKKTFDWLFDDKHKSGNHRPIFTKVDKKRQSVRETFANWLSRGGGVFHISGKPGAGKSTLMKYICENDRTLQLLNDWAGAKRLVLAKFFFWRYGTEVQKSWNGLIRYLLLSIVSECPHLIESIFPKQWKSVRGSKPCHFSAVDIDRTFTDLMKRKDVFEKHKFEFVIDGLDEFVGRDDELVASLFSWVNSWPTDIKICVSSRELPIFQQRFSECPKFRIHELTEPDMRIMVKTTMERNPDFNVMLGSERLVHEDLIDSLVIRAEGVFLWLTLALKTLEQGLLLEDSVNDLRKKIYSFPKEVENLFGAIFETIKTDLHPLDSERALRTLGFVTTLSHSSIRLTELEASFLDDYGDDMEFAEHMNVAVHVEERQNRLRRCRKQIEGRCRGLLNIVEKDWNWTPQFGIRYGDIAFTHRSLVEYFSRPDVMAYLEPYSHPNDIASFKCQAALAELKCAAPYLLKCKYNGESEEQRLASTREEPFEATGSVQRLATCTCYDIYNLGSLQSSLVMRMLQPLNLFAERFLDPPSFNRFAVSLDYDNHQAFKLLGLDVFLEVASQASFSFPLKAASLGMYDLSRTAGHDRALLERQLAQDPDTLRYLVHHQIGMVVCGKVGHTKEMLRAMLGCLELGASPQDKAYPLEFPQIHPTSANLWQHAVWIFFIHRCILLPQPFLLALIIYGADTSVWLEFDLTCPPEEGAAFVNWQFGSERKALFERMPLDPDAIGNIKLLELAKESGGILSLRHILQFWCPSSVHKFDKLSELKASHGGSGSEVDDVEYLKRLCGLDVENWNEAEWTVPETLLTPMPSSDEIETPSLSFED
ncbi:hypothetical protein FOVSG1_010066 [Fusarium oxysporum f. sp. vasinfectum]